jgi:hypothetical protein
MDGIEFLFQMLRIWTCLQCSSFFVQESAVIYDHRQIVGFEQKSRFSFGDSKERNHKLVVITTISSDFGPT